MLLSLVNQNMYFMIHLSVFSAMHNICNIIRSSSSRSYYKWLKRVRAQRSAIKAFVLSPFKTRWYQNWPSKIYLPIRFIGVLILHSPHCSSLYKAQGCSDSQSASSTLRGLINTKCDGTTPRPRAAGEGERRAALKQNQIVEIWEVLPSQHLACMGPTPLCNSI